MHRRAEEDMFEALLVLMRGVDERRVRPLAVRLQLLPDRNSRLTRWSHGMLSWLSPIPIELTPTTRGRGSGIEARTLTRVIMPKAQRS